jgi:hypothetical protein
MQLQTLYTRYNLNATHHCAICCILLSLCNAVLQVQNVVSAPQNDHLPLDVASRLCNSDLLSRADQLICFAFHDSNTIIETSREARALDMIVTELYLDRCVARHKVYSSCIIAGCCAVIAAVVLLL